MCTAHDLVHQTVQLQACGSLRRKALSRDDIGSGEPLIVRRIPDVLIARMRTDSERPRSRLSAEHLNLMFSTGRATPERAAPTDLAASPGPTASWWESVRCPLSDLRPASSTVQPTFPNSPDRTTSPAL